MSLNAIGASRIRSDAVAKVTGQAAYANDLIPDNALHGWIVRSSRAHAGILAVNADQARRMTGVHSVITADDLSDLFPRFGHIVADHPILAINKTLYYGEPVALVVAKSRQLAFDAASTVSVVYEDLEPILSMGEALSPDAPAIHAETYTSGDHTFAQARRIEGTNVCHRAEVKWGDVDAVFSSDVAIVETRMHYPMLYAYAMEPYNATASFDGGVLEVTSTAQHPFQVREELSRIFGLPLSRVRVRVPFIGGGYGSKSYTKLEPLAAVGAWITGGIVSVALDVEGAIHTTRGDSADVWVRTAFDDDGMILAREFKVQLDTGAYADNGPLVLDKAVRRCLGPYRIPNARAHGEAVYTNTVPSSSYRGFGAPQGALAGEVNLDQAAVHLNIDPADLRRRNLIGVAGVVIPGLRPMDADLVADLDLLTAKLGHPSPSQKGRGLGFGCTASDAGAFPVSSAMVRVQSDGSATVLVGSTEMGQGSRTVLAQIAAERLGIDSMNIVVVQSDTALVPYERTTGASRTTTLEGLAVMRACDAALEQLTNIAREHHGESGVDVEVRDGHVVSSAGSSTFAELIKTHFGSDQGEIVGYGLVRREGELEALPPFWEIGMSGVELGVDHETGEIEILHLVTVGDVGRAINPALVEGQDLGSATQGLGAALFEELIYDGPQLINPNMVDYRVPVMGDMPEAIDSLVVERGDGVGPGGAKGAGEAALNPIGGAVVAAFYRATGVWPTEIPLTPPKAWELMNPKPRIED